MLIKAGQGFILAVNPNKRVIGLLLTRKQSVNRLIDVLYTLVLALDSDNGVEEGVYNATVALCGSLLGESSASLLASSVDATDGCFYFDDGVDVEALFIEVCRQANNHVAVAV